MIKKYFPFTIIFFIGVFFGLTIHDLAPSLQEVRLTNPRAEVRYTVDKKSEENSNFKEAIQLFIQEATKSGDILSISVYFRAFGDGSWFGIREDISYAPASLLKVPLMIAYFKRAQVEQGILEKKIFYAGGEDRNEKELTRTASSLLPGTYSTLKLIERMIVHSGNNSQQVLEENIDKTFYKEVYTDLGLPFKKSEQEINFVSAKEIAIVFRILYNASYLNRASSERTLDFLTRTDFQDGLVGGVPDSLTVAHKFGERAYRIVQDTDEVIVIEFHDCGIVYALRNPYILCIMTKGQSLEEQKQAIQTISGLVYRKVTE